LVVVSPERLAMMSRRNALAALAGTAGFYFGRGAQADESVTLKPELAQLFVDAGTEGTFAALSETNGLVMTDETRSRRGVLPASTFKIPHALIALESGVVADTDNEVIHWDGVVRSIEAWNQDHTLRSAMKVSAVPVFQQIARRIGAPRMQKFVDAFNYGNRDIGGAEIDAFWLSGNLRISPLEQVQFLDRFLHGHLPVAKRTLDLVRDIVPVEDGIHAKTGIVDRDGKSVLAWLTGWAERDGRATLFALNLDLHGPQHMALRLPLAKTMLQRIGAV
jgi:beta-lactamase class D